MKSAERAVKLAKAGWPVRLIAMKLERHPQTVTHCLCEARRSGEIIGKAQKGYNQDGSIPLTIRGRTLFDTLSFAEATNTAPLELAETVLKYALSDIRIIAAALKQAQQEEEA